MPDLKKMLTLEALSEALPSWLKRSTKPEYNADEIDSTLTTNQFVTASDKDNWNAKGTYSKPSGGIPKSDLSSIVQTSLEKADSALQSETDPTVPSWAKQSSKPSYTQDEVADGSTYKRVTQTEKNTWNGKQNALTTTQMQAVNSGITSANLAQIIRNGAKNQLKLTGNVYNPNTLFVYWDYENGTVRVTGSTATTSTVFISLGSWTAPEDDVYRLYANGLACTANIRIYDDASWTTYAATSSESNEATWTKGTTRQLYLRIASNVVVGDITVTPMICQKSVFDADPSFVPYAASNHDLTRLESEDRSSLAEVVNSGAKNLLDFANVILSAYGVTQTKTDTTLTVTGATSQYGNVMFGLPKVSTAGYYVISFKVTAATKASGTRIMAQVYSNAGASGIPIIDTQITGTGNYQLEMNFAANTSYYLFIYPSRDSAQSSNSVTITDFMVCTKAAFDVSNKFVPYRVPITGLLSVVDKEIACSSTLTTTGIKFTATEKAAYRITATAIYYNSIPMKLAIKHKIGSGSTQGTLCTAVHVENEDVSLTVSGIRLLDVGGEFEIFAQYASSTNNRFYVLVEKLG